MKPFIKSLMGKASICGGALIVILIWLGTAASAEERAPTDKASDGYVFPINRKSAETLYEMKEQRLRAAQAHQAKEEEKLNEEKKKTKVEKIQRKTGRTATSWQVMNR
jgi:hypothetical protein